LQSSCEGISCCKRRDFSGVAKKHTRQWSCRSCSCHLDLFFVEMVQQIRTPQLLELQQLRDV
jgi:hypothetical protein